ncbi:MAG: tRNA preQ1(34) S-adenosylmethionine ribosyltransferase-isomerase QueA [Candidatus Magasanikbacteria bacterium RIFCSPHIGHO2_01_FULL_33_34]|uniref:S-adenosylmethionine:tRNA ribosyltransferase-isomerase n=1 Tax=Candidatus Magasanikbacteria bacterium RIFCSPHIGHO2_01_FULL_33_34 TaxID=1798671 RepID=A0A1F6LGQ0_9BACT|nr:MAG: tRNA preQ1(34) S-adenosylmethionine ribosyltransferase-isomerase QueA [Candidatus Magasanikbacteria bacterium RIFCSPHIGHO2_01_FULL_33_34]OGH66041.1 MAG: tRNA preQ1(34) S-adenosylmethionine ribosyltransferase-isomerase QueA [Candidatus Magasanikbacteria bacterium RIFCSPHIGHO2_02_FULL_33_17]OGH75887.1 MAG: tRNA preQ1(34) S-adenosylmethionine ribosyltransferase-isomerase QueA [Candidatus Magasanikbacteria bacterium RIFCSPLOWO2_01_FULL_33_34]OGH81665.1 MAG: tRNA preQ1(34) S-adenosylmethionin
MLTKDFDYHLPMERIAQKPIEPRDQSNLMLINKHSGFGRIKHKKFVDIVDEFKKGDLIVWNSSKVFKARLFGELLSGEGQQLMDHKKKIEVFLVRPMENKGVWKVLARPGKHVSSGTKVRFAPGFECVVMAKEVDGTILVQFGYSDDEVKAKANKFGKVPIPPYVKDEVHELEIYQTIYADKEGSVAAPTAGFHFTPELIEKIKAKGVEFAEVTLHVGLGTFLPIKSERVEDHTMHSEQVELTQINADKINKAKEEGRRVIAVGTTTVRTLEGIAKLKSSKLIPYMGDINIFIKPGFKFEIVDALITNFHLPKSTLLMLVSAFLGNRKFMLKCYKVAVKKKYRFYSFGDAMFIK